MLSFVFIIIIIIAAIAIVKILLQQSSPLVPQPWVIEHLVPGTKQRSQPDTSGRQPLVILYHSRILHRHILKSYIKALLETKMLLYLSFLMCTKQILFASL